MAVRAIRGATQLDRDERDHLLDRTTELVRTVLRENTLSTDDLISIVFTATDDVRSEFPAYAARVLGLVDVPLMCARELEIEGSLPRVVRLMMHVETSLTRAEVTHVYLHGAAGLRRDLTHVSTAAGDADETAAGESGAGESGAGESGDGESGAHEHGAER